ncbi:MAG TPA: hypothetical protein V6D04_13790 [Candidatus Obscuribacterales bacterium]
MNQAIAANINSRLDRVFRDPVRLRNGVKFFWSLLYWPLSVQADISGDRFSISDTLALI